MQIWRTKSNKLKLSLKSVKFDHAIKGLDNPMSLKEIRRDIARLKTEARRRVLSKMTDSQLMKRTKLVARRKHN